MDSAFSNGITFEPYFERRLAKQLAGREEAEVVEQPSTKTTYSAQRFHEIDAKAQAADQARGLRAGLHQLCSVTGTGKQRRDLAEYRPMYLKQL
jgi:hypothetical protein